MSEILVWRLCARRREPWAFTGEGAARRGGRWNTPGVRVIYCAESRSLAAMEVLVHADQTATLASIEWVCIPVVLPERQIESPVRFPETWRQYPHARATQEFGAHWVRENRSAALRVPSAVVPGEFNYLINPGHAHFAELKIGKSEPFAFDPRLME